MTGRGFPLLRWDDGTPLPARELGEQLMLRPGCRAVVAEDLGPSAVPEVLAVLRRDLGDGFEVEARPADDGPYGVRYEVLAWSVTT